MTNIDIWGTCYSREIFNYSNDFTVNNYLMQQSIYTIDQKPLNIYQESIKTTDGYKFKEKMMYYELNKLAINAIKEKHCDLILIDLFDQIRKYLHIIYPNTKMICTSEMRILLSRLEYNYYDLDPQLLDYNRLIEYINKYIEILVSLYDKNNIIFNVAQLPHEYYEKGVKKEFSNNWIIDREKFLKGLEKIFLSILPESIILKTTQIPIVDINHYLGGPHPAHYEKIYYEYRSQILNALLKDKPEEKIEEEYLHKYNESINKIKNKELILRLR